MCGIAGFANLSNKFFSVDQSLVQKLCTTLKHRGPDGSGIWICNKREVAFAHTRLSILDLSCAGKQPMADIHESVILTFNGEIYNYCTLKKELMALGYEFRTKTDTEVILYAYKQWGIEFLHRIEGMFAFALFDINKNELYLARDRVGIKPLYFSIQDNILSFASEIKALWNLPWNNKTLKKDALYHYLTYLATPAPMTLYKDIYKLPAGFYAKINAQKEISFKKWYCPIVYTPPALKKKLTKESFCVAQIRSLLKDSIKKRMMADVPVGVFLSGGIDSSLNVALMAELTDKLKTFNVSFADGPEFEERAWARKIAKKFGTDHHELIIGEKEAFEFFNKMVYHQDEPLGDSVCIPVYYVAQLAKEHGVTVVQVGEGSDELFCGYRHYTQYLWLHKYWKYSQKFIPTMAKRGLYYAARKIHQKNDMMLDLMRSWSDERPLFWSGAVVIPEIAKPELIQFDSEINEPDAIINKIYAEFNQSFDSYAIADYHRNQLLDEDPHADFFKTMTYLELKHRLPELLLMRVDKMAMATSIEARVPFLDHKLIEFALQIPMKLKYKQGETKYILKKACEGILPRDIIYRKKMGFAAPTQRWFKKGTYFKSHLHDMMHTQKKSDWSELLNFQSIEKMMYQTQHSKTDYSYQLWALQNVLAFDVGQK